MKKHIILFISLVLLSGLLQTSCKSTKNSAGDNSKKKNKTLSATEQLQVTAIFLEANREKILGNFTKAAALFAECIRKDPSDDASFFELASILTNDKKYDDALVLAREAVALKPDNIWYQLLLAEIYANKNQTQEAVKIYERLIRVSPLNTDYYFELAMLHLYRRNYSDAIKVYNRLEKIIGINEELSVQKHQIYLYNNDFDKAAAELEKLIATFPSEHGYKLMLADLYLDNGQKEKALLLYEQVAAKDPSNGFVNLSLADYYRSIGRNDLFDQQLLLAFASPYVDIESKVKILLSYFTITEDKENPDFLVKAYAFLDLLIATHPADAMAYSIYGDFLSRDNRTEEARNMFLKVVQLDNSRYAVWEQLLLLQSDIRDYAGLDTLSAQALELFPEQPLLYLFNGFSNYMLGFYEKAVVSFKNGIQYAVFNEKLRAEFYMYLGDAYNHLKQYPESDAAYDNVLKIDPDNVTVLNNYSYYLSLRADKPEKAISMAKKANDLKPGIASYQDTYAWALYVNGNYEEALKWVEKAIEGTGQNNHVIVEHYGDILYKLNRKSEALEQWKKAAEKGKGSENLSKKIETGTLE